MKFISPSGLISIAGGKLTGYRKMAQRIVDLVAKELKADSSQNFGPCQTKELRLNANPFANAKAVQTYINRLEGAVKEVGLSAYHAWYLTTVYGKQAEAILEKMKDFSTDNARVALARAEAWFTTTYEMVNSAADFFVRRTGRLYFDIESIPAIETAVLSDFQSYLGWNEERLQKEKEGLEMLLYDATHYYDADLTE